MTIWEFINSNKCKIVLENGGGNEKDIKQIILDMINNNKENFKTPEYNQNGYHTGYSDGYNKAIDDFVEHITIPITTEEQISEIVEQLKKEN